MNEMKRILSLCLYEFNSINYVKVTRIFRHISVIIVACLPLSHSGILCYILNTADEGCRIFISFADLYLDLIELKHYSHEYI